MNPLHLIIALTFVCSLLSPALARNIRYFFLNEKMSFNSAETACQQRFGGHLASISDSDEQSKAMMAVRIAKGMGSNKHIWIGLKETSENKLQWVDNSIVNYSNFAQDGSSRNGTCVHIQLDTEVWYLDDCNINLASVCIFTEADCEPVPVCESGWTWFNETNACYKVIHDMKNFFDYQNHCKDMQSRLASIHSQAENDFIVELSKQGQAVDDPDKQVFIGLIRKADNSTFKWTDGTPIDFAPPWAANEPNNANYRENCVEIYVDVFNGLIPNTPYLYRWNDRECSSSMRAAVCKKAATTLKK